MASPHVEWHSFAKSMGWDPVESKKGLNINRLISKKKELLSVEHASKVAELVFDYKSRWHQEVLQTLKEYPKASDAMLEILKAKMNHIIKAIKNDEQLEKTGSLTKENSQFKKISTIELSSLASAIKTITETKYKSLLISDWNVKVAEAVTTPKAMEQEQNKVADTEWTIEVMGHEKVSVKEMQKLINDWYDKPMLPHTREELDAES